MVGGAVYSWLGFGGNGWDVPILVACILACFIIAASTPVLLVLYIKCCLHAKYRHPGPLKSTLGPYDTRRVLWVMLLMH